MPDHRAPVAKSCLFCQIVEREHPAYLVYEDAATLVFLDHRPLRPGHCLVVPKQHVATLVDLPQELIEPLFATVQRVARAVETGLDAAGSFVAINNRISQSVPHLHVHVVPRQANDGLFARGLVWTRHPYPDEAAARAIQKSLQAALANSDRQ